MSTLRELAAKATKGPWQVGLFGGVYPKGGGVCILDASHRDGEKRENGTNNEAFIARLSPDVAIKVYEYLEKKREEMAGFVKVAGCFNDDGSTVQYQAELDEVTAVLKLLDGGTEGA